MSFKSDFQCSSRDFIEVVWPAIAPMVEGGEFIPVEMDSKSDLARLLDRYSGIDAFQLLRKGHRLRALASRVQWIESGKKPYNTFTIRLDRSNGAVTEFEKRWAAIQKKEEGWLYPHLSIQAYLSEDRALLDAAVVETTDLFHFADDGLRSLLEYNGNDFGALMQAVRDGGHFSNNKISLNCCKTKEDDAVFIAVDWMKLQKQDIRLKRASKHLDSQPDFFIQSWRI